MWYSWQFFPRFAINQNRQRSAPCRGWTFAACQAGRALGGSGGGCWLGFTAKVAEPSHNYCVVNPVTPMMNCLVWFGLRWSNIWPIGDCELGLVQYKFQHFFRLLVDTIVGALLFRRSPKLERWQWEPSQQWAAERPNLWSFLRANSRWKWWKWCNILNSLHLPLIPGTPTTFLWLQNSQPWTDGSPVDPPEGCKECCSWAARRRGRVILQATHVDPIK